MPTAAELLAQARAWQSAGNLQNAEELFRRALSADATQAEPHNALGAVLGQQGKLVEAEASIRRALELQPDFAEAYYNLAAVALCQNQFDLAANNWRQSIALKPDYVDAHANLATLAARQNRPDEAAECWRRVVELQPDHAEGHYQLGAMLVRLARLDEAAASFRRALALRPDSAGAHQALGSVLHAQRQLDEATRSFRRAAELKPDFAEAHGSLGAALAEQGNADEAIAAYRRAVELKPEFSEAHNNLGALLEARDQLEDAAACYRRALTARPDFAAAHNNLGAVLEKLGRFDEAAACWRRALELRPDFPEATNNLGILLGRQGRVEEAAACYRQALRLHPQQTIWELNRLSLCPVVLQSNDEIDRYRQDLAAGLAEIASRKSTLDRASLVRAACTPSFNLQFHGRDDRPIREAYARVYQDYFPSEPPAPTRSAGRPRVGLVVSDRHEALFLRSLGGVLDHLNPALFDVLVIASERGAALVRPAIHNSAVQVLGVRNTFDDFVQAVRDAQCDLLYYWEVATDNTNYFLPFLRLAPVQCTSWGIQVTSGIGQLDNYISSELVEPADAAEHYSEHLVLARTLLSYQRRVALSSSPRPREFFGVAAQQHLYVCAHQLGKFQPDFDPILAGILRRDTAAVIAITEDRHGAYIANQLRQRFAATMPDVAGRIVILPLQPNADYLSLIAAADVLLDPLYFGGVNSTYDGFSLHKPIVTLPSRFQRGRYTLGCYRKMGLTDCVATTPEQYVEIAVRLGTDAAWRADVVSAIRLASPALFDDLEAVREHERIFGELIEQSRAGNSA